MLSEPHFLASGRDRFGWSGRGIEQHTVAAAVPGYRQDLIGTL
jgi:hypothetical protein